MNSTLINSRASDEAIRDRKRLITAIFGVTLALGGLHHGFFEILQGNNPTPGMFVESIGPEHRTWLYGNDPAVTLIPNFLVTGIMSVLISLSIIIWSLFFVGKKHGPDILLLLFILLTLTGGGVGHIPFFILVWAYARRPDATYRWWEKHLPAGVKRFLSGKWMYITIASALFFVIGLEISVFGYFPGITDPDQMLAICWSFLFLSLALINFSYISAFVGKR